TLTLALLENPRKSKPGRRLRQVRDRPVQLRFRVGMGCKRARLLTRSVWVPVSRKTDLSSPPEARGRLKKRALVPVPPRPHGMWPDSSRGLILVRIVPVAP